MSLIRDPAIITTAGSQMMTAGGDITYTEATLYGQDISHLTKDQLESLTSIGNPLMTVPVGISDKSDNDNATTVVIEATFQNANLNADLPYTAVGFFAKRSDDTDKLVLVGIANPGAYLVAASPDGVATDALDIKVAIAIGDATSVTAVVDPAGSVTPATLNGAINNLSHDLTAKIDANQTSTTKALDTKADKTTVSDQLATKANQSDLDKTNAEVVKKADSADVTAQLDTKADKTDVANSVKQLQAGIDSKADKSVVDAEIAKIDFTPYAKTVDVNSKLAGYTTTADLTKLLAGKRDISDSYSRAELDKKLLEMSADTDGKVNADQVANMIAGKADKTAVDAELAKKDDTTDVDAKINSNVTKLNQAINTKANASDVYTKPQIDTAFSQRDQSIINHTNSVQSEVNKLNASEGHGSGVDVNTFTGESQRVHVYTLTSEDNKNTPPWISDHRGTLVVINYDGNAKTQLWFPVGSGNDKSIGVRYWESTGYSAWNRVAIQSDIDSLLAKITNATNIGNQASQKVDSTLANSFVRKQGMNANGDLVEIRGNATKQPNGGYDFDMYSSDWTASKLKDVLNALPGKASTTDVANANNNANGRLPLGGGNMTLRSTINWNGGGIDDKTGNLGGITWNGGTDWAKIYGDQDDNDNLDLAFDLGDDGSNHFSFRQNGSETSAITSDGHYTGTVDWGHVNGRPQDQVDRVNIITPLFRQIQNSNNWNDIFGVGNPNNVLTSLRIDSGGSGALLNDFAAGIGFGGADTKGVLSVAYQDHQARITGGNGNGPVWSEDIAWKSDINSLLNTITTLQNQVNELINQINYIKQNYLQGRRFPASQEAQAEAWENENPQRIAFITK